MNDAHGRHPAMPYAAPFAVFILFLAVEKYLPFGPDVAYPLRVMVVSAVLFTVSRSLLRFRLTAPWTSLLLGIGVFVIWVAPDFLWPQYRDHWLFSNSLLGKPVSQVPEDLRTNLVFLVFRSAGCFLLVPVIEELFWRGFLARWLIRPDFQALPLGAYTAFAFWAGSILFALEHGPFWEVGLAAGLLYNAWMIRTKSLGDCILAHAVTNLCLTGYVLAAGQWRYWV